MSFSYKIYLIISKNTWNWDYLWGKSKIKSVDIIIKKIFR